MGISGEGTGYDESAYSDVNVALDQDGTRVALLVDEHGALVISGVTSGGGDVTIDLTELIEAVRDTQGLTTQQLNALTTGLTSIKAATDAVKSVTDQVRAAAAGTTGAVVDGTAAVTAALALVRAAVQAIPEFDGVIANWPSAFPAPATVAAIEQVSTALGSLSVTVPGVATESTLSQVLAAIEALDLGSGGAGGDVTIAAVAEGLLLPVVVDGGQIDLGSSQFGALAKDQSLQQVVSLLSGQLNVVLQGSVDGVVFPLPQEQLDQLIDALGNTGGGGGTVELPDDYPLPDSQVATLTPQKDAATAAQIGALGLSTEATLVAIRALLETVGGLHVNSSGHVQPVSAASLPLPEGAATNATVQAVVAALGGVIKTDASATTQPISVATLPLPTGAATQATLEAVRVLLTGTLKVDGSTVTQPISAAALPLPAGASTQATSEAIRALLAGGIAVTGPLTASQLGQAGLATQATLEAARALLAGTLKVDGSGVTQPVSASALPLPAGAATQTTTEAIRALLATSGGLPVAATPRAQKFLAADGSTLIDVSAANPLPVTGGGFGGGGGVSSGPTWVVTSGTFPTTQSGNFASWSEGPYTTLELMVTKTLQGASRIQVEISYDNVTWYNVTRRVEGSSAITAAMSLSTGSPFSAGFDAGSGTVYSSWDLRGAPYVRASTAGASSGGTVNWGAAIFKGAALPTVSINRLPDVTIGASSATLNTTSVLSAPTAAVTTKRSGALAQNTAVALAGTAMSTYTLYQVTVNSDQPLIVFVEHSATVSATGTWYTVGNPVTLASDGKGGYSTTLMFYRQNSFMRLYIPGFGTASTSTVVTESLTTR